MSNAYYSHLLKRINALERVEFADTLPYYVVIAPVGRCFADQTYTGPFVAYELYKRKGKPDAVKQIPLTDYREYVRPEGCTCTCLYMVRRKILATAGERMLFAMDQYETPIDSPAGGCQTS